MSSLQNRLYNYEQAPPEKVWGKIAAALDESHISDTFPAKLYNAEAAPPASSWEQIVNSLDAEHAPVISVKRKSFPLFRYAAAVVLTGLLTFGIIKWTGNNDKTTDGGLATSKEHLSPDDRENDLPGETSVAINNDERRSLAPEEDNTHLAAINGAKTSRIRKAISGNIEPAEAIYAYNEHTPDLADRYVMLMTPNGIVRMSKKLGNIVCCVAGEEQDKDCKDQIKKWQEKLATSSVAPAPGNFMDILSLVSSLNEDEL